MSFKDTKKVTCGRLGLNYNDVEIDITWRSHVREHQYFSISIACDMDFKNMMELFVQSETNMMKLYMSSQTKLKSSYNVGMKILMYLYPYLLCHSDNYHI
jgi:hypothetical protein